MSDHEWYFPEVKEMLPNTGQTPSSSKCPQKSFFFIVWMETALFSYQIFYTQLTVRPAMKFGDPKLWNVCIKRHCTNVTL